MLFETLKVFSKWRIFIFVVTLLIVPLANHFQVFSNFDGQRFLDIASLGYGTTKTAYSYSLFPFYPLAIKYFASLMGYLGSGLFLSHLFTFASLYMFQKLGALDYSKKAVHKSLILFLLFPASFFLVSIYSESLFLFLCLTSVYLSRKGSYLFSALFALLASYTRSVGVFLWVLLVLEYFIANSKNLKTFLKPAAISLLLPPLGFLYYINYLQVNTSNILNFLPTIPQKFVFLHQVYLRYAKMLVFIDHFSPLFWIILTECIVGVFALYLLVISYKKMRFSYWTYFFLSFFVPTFWGNFTGMSRFLLVVFPIFYFLGDWIEHQHPYFQKFYILISTGLLAVNFSLFINGIFVG